MFCGLGGVFRKRVSGKMIRNVVFVIRNMCLKVSMVVWCVIRFLSRCCVVVGVFFGLSLCVISFCCSCVR